MLYIDVDEGYAFDFLSILDVKKIKLGANAATEEYWNSVYENLCDELGNPIVDAILKSPEYAVCVDANSKMFDLVDLAKTDKVTARESDRGNYARCEAKKALQKKFFGNDISEIKIGYETYEKEAK